MMRSVVAVVAAVFVGAVMAQVDLEVVANTIFSETRTVQTACPERFASEPGAVFCGQTDASFRLFDALLEAGTYDLLEPATAWSLENGLYTREYQSRDGAIWRLDYVEGYAPNGENGVFLAEVLPEADPQSGDGSDMRRNWEARLGELNESQRGWIELIEGAIDVQRVNCPQSSMERRDVTACFAIPRDREFPWLWQQAATRGDLPPVTWDESRSDRGSAFLGSGSSQAYLTYYTRDYFNPEFRNRLFVRF